MKLSDAYKLLPGDEVNYNDPNGDMYPTTITINEIKIKEGVVCITGEDGKYFECFAKELE